MDFVEVICQIGGNCCQEKEEDDEKVDERIQH